ncbi:MAG: sensor histidine kinase [Solirubrobacteraceae bacterium]
MNKAQTHSMAVPGLGPKQPSSRPRRRVLSTAVTGARDLLYLCAVFGMSIIGLVVWIAGLSLSVGLLVLIIGALVWIATTYAFRWTTMIDRRLAGWLRREPIAAVYRTPAHGGVLARLRAVTRDPQTWKNLGWLVLNSTVGFVLSLGALVATIVVLGYVMMPAWWWAIADPHTQYGTLNLGIYTVTSTGSAFLTTALGLLLTPVLFWINRGAACGHAALAARVLSPSDSQLLSARVDELASTRAGAVEAASEQLERIERDLHDGAQARLVALAMELGMAEEEVARDPNVARETVRKARDEALGALRELRDLSRGLRPAMLQERGLGAAIDELARRAALPVTITVAGAIEQAPEPVRTAAYFVVAEALTNATKHAEARTVRVSIERDDGSLAITVIDDGKGGADTGGSGLAGLEKRVRALDGRLAVTSPAGGPTSVIAEIPCV